jgi:hypothetical protein
MKLAKSSLAPGQRRLVEIIEALGFGVIERMPIRAGLPIFDPEPRVVQTIKLDLAPEYRSHRDADLTLKKEFEILFEHLGGLGDGVVDVEIRHGLPSRLVLERRYEELVR